MTPVEFRTIRKSISPRQSIVGDMIGVSVATIVRIEIGRMGDPIPTIYALAIERLVQVSQARVETA